MKQVFCITAYKDFDYLRELAADLSSIDCFVYIHIDKKFSDSETLSKLNGIPNVVAVSKYSVPWGGYQHIQAAVELIRMACEDISDRFYVHLITGQDILCKSKQELFAFFNSDNYSNYMSCSDSSNNSFRYKTFYRNDWFNYKSKIGNFATKFLYCAQRVLLINRHPPKGFKKIYKGMLYVSITSEFAKYVIHYLGTAQGKKYFNWIKWCFIPEEFFFQTLLMNSEFANTLVINNYRYALWSMKHGTQPGILDEDDFESISASNAFFARKISSVHSSNLIKMLKGSK